MELLTQQLLKLKIGALRDDGTTDLQDEDRWSFMCEHLKPTINGYDKFVEMVDDDECTPETEALYIIPFEEKADELMDELEKRVATMMADHLSLLIPAADTPHVEE